MGCFVVNVPILFSDCRSYSNRRKAGNVCLFPQAQAGTDRLPPMMARSVTLLSSSCNSIRTHITQAKVFTHFSLLPHNTRGQCAWARKGKGGGGGGEFGILTAWWTNLSFSLLVLPQSLYTSFLMATGSCEEGGWGLLGCRGHSGAGLKSKHLGWRGKWHDNIQLGLLIGLFSFKKKHYLV